MDTLGHDFIPPGIHAGGLRYHGMAPMVSHCHQLGLIEASLGHADRRLLGRRVSFARSEGIIPAPESNHAIAVVRQLAEECKQSGDEKTILFNLSGHGHFDMAVLRQLPRRQARGLRLSGREDQRGDEEPAQGVGEDNGGGRRWAPTPETYTEKESHAGLLLRFRTSTSASYALRIEQADLSPAS